ncbi:MAG: NAD(P)H-binding protein [Chthoniobacterales bacterium]
MADVALRCGQGPHRVPARVEPGFSVTGATGYIGGRRIPRLLEAGFCVRSLVREVSRLQGRTWHGEIDLIEGDVLWPDSLSGAMVGATLACYLVHSLGSGPDFFERDLQAARNFNAAAKSAGVGRMIYLGGLGDPATNLSAHLPSRQQTGDALRESGVP